MLEETEGSDTDAFDVPWRVPRDNVEAYARLFQLEDALREMVYLELRAGYGAKWEDEFEHRVGNKHRRAERTKSRDKNLSHMRTRDERILAYADIGDLFSVIYDASTQSVDPMFAQFFPPAAILGGRIAEIIPIRLRTMHCRSLHADDVARLIQFMRDLDQGFWRWCTSYNSSHIEYSGRTDEPIGNRIKNHNVRLAGWKDDYPYPISVELSYSLRPGWRTDDWRNRPVGGAGWLYHFRFYGNPHSERSVDTQEFLRSTRAMLGQCVYVHVGDIIEVSMPGRDNSEDLLIFVDAFVDAAQSSAFRRQTRARDSEPFYNAVLRSYPEWVLGPMHPLSFLCDDMPCSWFGLDVPVPPRGRF